MSPTVRRIKKYCSEVLRQTRTTSRMVLKAREQRGAQRAAKTVLAIIERNTK
jgi:hypothetical protein